MSEAQVRWLNDPRPYSHPWSDRTFRALIDKGAVVEGDDKDWHTGRCGYVVTDAGRAALKKANTRSWFCDPCKVEVYERRCPHCGKLEHEKS